jgi:uncharacterized protein (DUF1697 family)
MFDTKTTNTRSLETKIEKHLAKSLGYEVTTFLRLVTELATIAQHQPFSEEELTAEGNTLYIGFVRDKPPSEVVKKLESLSSAIDAFHVHEREVYWLYRRNNGESKYYGAALEKGLTMQATLRNVNTVNRIVAKYCKK